MLELSENRLSDYSQFNTEFLSKENDVDMAKVLTDLSMQQTVMNSALKTAAKIIPPTLVDFL
jgi:flagellar hook-associated protein 3 FlgL